MKIYRFVPAALLLCMFTFTSVASAYNAPSLAVLGTQLQGLLLQLSALLDGQHQELAATVTVPATSILPPRTCQISFVSHVNGVTKTATTTVSGSTSDQFAVGFSIGTSTDELPFSVILQHATWTIPVKGAPSRSGVVGYFTPEQYQNNRTRLDTYSSDGHYKVVSFTLANTNISSTSSPLKPNAEVNISNSAMPNIGANKVGVAVFVNNCVDPVAIAAKKPNIVFVLTDDLDVGMLSQLPKLKALMADKGMTFENHYTSLSLCCPSRAATLCGQYAHNNGVFTNDAVNADGTNGALTAFNKNGDESKTMAVWLQNAGYRTALMGKYLNGYSADAGIPFSVPAGWSEWAVPIDGNPYSQYNYTLNVNGTPEEHYLAYCKNKGSGAICPLRYASSTLAERQSNFMINVLSNKAKDFMTRSGQAGKSFFLYLAPYTPHGPATPAPRYENLLTDKTWLAAHPYVKPLSFNEADVSDKPSWLKDNAGLLSSANESIMNTNYHKRLISMYAVEDMVSTLIDTLSKNGQLDNTYIVFTSDNGFHLGEHRLTGGKLTEFDTDLHIPLIIRGPKVPEGSVATQLTANVDIAPTFASLAGLTVPDSVDGRSFKGVLLGASSSPRYALLIEHADPANATQIKTLASATAEPRDTETQDAPISGGEYVTKYSGVRTPRFTYVHYVKNDEEELYDNTNDPQQLVNIAKTAGPDLLTRLRTWTSDLSTCKGATCRSIEGQNRLSGARISCAFGDTVVEPGKSVTAYSSFVAPLGGTCDSIKQVRTCTSGVLSGDANYTRSSCSDDQPNQTTLSTQKDKNDAVVTLPDQTLLMLRSSQPLVGTSTGASQFWIERSNDNGKTWTLSKPNFDKTFSVQPLNLNGESMNILSSATDPLHPGRILAAYHKWRQNVGHSLETMYSDDLGNTWSYLSQIDLVPSQVLPVGIWESFMLQPKLRPGKIQVYYAKERDDAVVCTNHVPGVLKGQDIVMAESADGGKTWGPVQIVLRNGFSREGVPSIAETADGALYLAHEHALNSDCSKISAAAASSTGQDRVIGIAQSIDGGATWQDIAPAFLPSNSVPSGSWPHMITLADGRLLFRFGVGRSLLFMTTNAPSHTVLPVWEKTAMRANSNPLGSGYLMQAPNGDIIAFGNMSTDDTKSVGIGKYQYYRTFPVSTLPAFGQ